VQRQCPEEPRALEGGEVLRGLLARRDLAAAAVRDALAKRFGVTGTEVAALAHLAQRGALTVRELGYLLQLSSGGATTVVQRLERTGHVVREPHPLDRRSALLCLTPSAVRQLSAAWAPLVEELDGAAAQLTETEEQLISGYLERVVLATEAFADELRRQRAEEAGALNAIPAAGLWA
jgi:DNA-binding MarR family transcriptional regulator